MSDQEIPLNRFSALGRELEYAGRAVESGRVGGDQEFTKRCEGILEDLMGVRRALLTTSCTHALEMAAMLLGIREGDEVIVPSFTFVSTANAFVLRGAKPVFCDVRADTLNLDESLLEGLVTERTRAIVPVHYGGVGCEMDEIMGFASARGLAVVEDNAHGLFGKYRGRWLGSIGSIATQSFHETKNLSCGEGGALLVNDPDHVPQAEVLREKGTNRSRFFRGEIDKYSWVDLGSSYVMSEILAAVLAAQLESWREVQSQRERIWRRYDEELAPWCAEHGVGTATVPPHCDPAFHLYYLMLPDGGMRGRLIEHLKRAGIRATFHYLPLHLSEYAARWGGRPGQCPVAEDASERLLRLPMFAGLDESGQDRVIREVKSFEI